MEGIIANTVYQISSMHIRGAGNIARAGAFAIGKFADEYKGRSLEKFKKDLKIAVDMVISQRPTAVSLWNGVHAAIYMVNSAETLDSMKERIYNNSKIFIKKSIEAVHTIAHIGAKRIQDGDTLMTHCNSSAVLQVIKEAYHHGKNIMVYATETRPQNQGILTVKELANEGIDVTMIVDSAVHTVMKRINKVFVGADTIFSNGALVNKIGTSQVALAAHEANVHFYVCSETYKFSPMTIFGDTVSIEERNTSDVIDIKKVPSSVKVFNPIFDITPARYIDDIITEIGIISPGSAYYIMNKQLGNTVFME